MVSYSVTLGFGRHTAAVVAEHGMARTVITAKWQILAFRMAASFLTQIKSKLILR